MTWGGWLRSWKPINIQAILNHLTNFAVLLFWKLFEGYAFEMIENQDIGGSRLTKFGNAARLVLSAIRYLQSLERIKLRRNIGKYEICCWTWRYIKNYENVGLSQSLWCIRFTMFYRIKLLEMKLHDKEWSRRQMICVIDYWARHHASLRLRHIKHFRRKCPLGHHWPSLSREEGGKEELLWEAGRCLFLKFAFLLELERIKLHSAIYKCQLGFLPFFLYHLGRVSYSLATSQFQNLFNVSYLRILIVCAAINILGWRWQ